MLHFMITPRGDTREAFAIEADNIQQAATLACFKLFPELHRSSTVALRVTGDTGKSGLFQCYQRGMTAGSALNSFGRAFHVRQL